MVRMIQVLLALSALLVLAQGIRLNEITTTGTSNSYRLRPPFPFLPEWNFSSNPLEAQVASDGSRVFEFDVWYDAGADDFVVAHVLEYDAHSMCANLTSCLARLHAAVRGEYPNEYPTVFVVVEVKNPGASSFPSSRWDALDAAIAAGWPQDEIATPRSMLDAAGVDSVREMALGKAWPHLADVRSKALVLVLDVGLSYEVVGGSRLGFPLQPPSDVGDPRVGFVSYDWIDADLAELGTLVGLGYMVRARTDRGYLGKASYTQSDIVQLYFATTDSSGDGLVSVAELGAFIEASGIIVFDSTVAGVVTTVFQACGDTGSGISITSLSCVTGTIASLASIDLIPSIAAINKDPALSTSALASGLAAGAHLVQSRYVGPDFGPGGAREAETDFFVAMDHPYVCNAQATGDCSPSLIDDLFCVGSSPECTPPPAPSSPPPPPPPPSSTIASTETNTTAAGQLTPVASSPGPERGLGSSRVGMGALVVVIGLLVVVVFGVIGAIIMSIRSNRLSPL